ncbi:hypothetical protein CPA57_06570 [Bombella sp. TMW2.1880]|uniref:Uncharacterized protein n=1 Tax=Bombella favorum TaxID=2039164 RepID=A0ABR5ZNW9_9PROT|nr:hypothetical protein [Bombella favorum]
MNESDGVIAVAWGIRGVQKGRKDVLLCLHFLAASAKEPAGFVVGPSDGRIFRTLGTGVLIP